MNTPTSTPLETRIARSIAVRLSDSTQSLPSDISERLRAARERALAKRKIVRLQLVSSLQLAGAHSATLPSEGEHQGLWARMATAIPLLVLVVGLLGISFFKEQERAAELAAVDAELLVDELPPAAFTDPGFLHFLNTARRD